MLYELGKEVSEKEAGGSHETTKKQYPLDVITEITGDSGKNPFCGMIKRLSVRVRKKEAETVSLDHSLKR